MHKSACLCFQPIMLFLEPSICTLVCTTPFSVFTPSNNKQVLVLEYIIPEQSEQEWKITNFRVSWFVKEYKPNICSTHSDSNSLYSESYQTMCSLHLLDHHTSYHRFFALQLQVYMNFTKGGSRFYAQLDSKPSSLVMMTQQVFELKRKVANVQG